MTKAATTCPNCHQDFLVLSPATLTDPDFVHLRCLNCKHTFKRPKEDQSK
ncbi:hypothetical protein ES703_14169 [subsurface metagenome]